MTQLKFWFDLANLSDTHGLPPDLIWVKLDEMNHPISKQFSSEQFENQIKQVIKYRQLSHKRDNFPPTSPPYIIADLFQEMMKN